jgi:Myb-like DNA-binding protein FlbD
VRSSLYNRFQTGIRITISRNIYLLFLACTTNTMACHRRGPWSQAEDAYLMQLVHRQGPLNWVRIAQTLGSRTPKQCRERYHQNLKPSLNHDPITPDEGLQIEQLVHEIGKRWAEIARRLHGRSDNAVKNWWNGSQNRRKRLDRRRTIASSPMAAYDRERQYSSFARSELSLSRPIPMSLCVLSSPPSPPYYRHGHYGVEAPLPSPSTSESAAGDSPDTAPSLVSDSSSYTASPRGPTSSLSSPPVELHPHKNIGGLTRASPHLPRDSKLMDMGQLPSPVYARPDENSRLPPIHHWPESFQGKSYLPTAPNSPVTLPQLRLPRPACPIDKDSRMDVSALLG